MGERLSPIPTPPAMRWRLFRVRAVPVVTFAISAIVVAAMWRRTVAPPVLLAEAESIHTEVRSLQAGMLRDVHVRLLQRVTAGDIVATVQTTPPAVVESSLAVIRAEIELIRAGMAPVVEQQRVAVDLEQLRLDWMQARVQLASLRAQLVQSEADLARASTLHRNNLIAVEAYEQAANLRDSLRAQVATQEELVAGIEPSLLTLGGEGGAVDPEAATTTLRAAIKVQEEQLRLAEAQLRPAQLPAPCDGVVSSLLRRNGEAVSAGEPILIVAAERPARLVGFVRQPLAFTPQTGARVEVRVRRPVRIAAFGTVEDVGAVLEPISPTLLASINRATTPELGLRVHITPPPGLDLYPGEQVDVIVHD